MFNFLIVGFFVYYFYRNTVQTGKFKAFMRRTIPGIVIYLQNVVDKIEGRETRKYHRQQNSNYMSIEEAKQILGIQTKNPSKEEVLAAFKKLMLINHPDKGGTEYIAAKIIQAKQILIKD